MQPTASEAATSRFWLSMRLRWFCKKAKHTKNVSRDGLKVTFRAKRSYRIRKMTYINHNDIKSVASLRNYDQQRNMLCKLSFQTNANFGTNLRAYTWRRREHALVLVKRIYIPLLRFQLKKT